VPKTQEVVTLVILHAYNCYPQPLCSSAKLRPSSITDKHGHRWRHWRVLLT